MKSFVTGALLGLVLGFVGYVVNGPLRDGLHRAATDAGERRGWLDGATLTDAQRRRTTALGALGSTDKAAARSGRETPSREDVELLRQDARRAMAAYPSARPDDLIEGRWMPFDPSSRVPSEWGGANSESVLVDGQWYLEGVAYVGVVRHAFPDRATPERTLAYFAEAARTRAQARARRADLSWSSFGTGGMLDVRCSLREGCVVSASPEGSASGSKWTFPFVAKDWASRDLFTLEEIEAMPSFAMATVEDVAVKPVGVVVSYGAIGAVTAPSRAKAPDEAMPSSGAR